jgi:hypothetical protein
MEIGFKVEVEVERTPMVDEFAFAGCKCQNATPNPSYHKTASHNELILLDRTIQKNSH